jgi:hypothetical protein
LLQSFLWHAAYVPIVTLSYYRTYISNFLQVQHTIAIVEPPSETNTLESLHDPLSTKTSTEPSRGGHLFGWGSNFFGQAGFMIENDQSMGSWGEDEDDLDVVELPNAIKLVDKDNVPIRVHQVITGDFHSIALDSTEGRVWSWGGGILGTVYFWILFIIYFKSGLIQDMAMSIMYPPQQRLNFLEI